MKVNTKTFGLIGLNPSDFVDEYILFSVILLLASSLHFQLGFLYLSFRMRRTS